MVQGIRIWNDHDLKLSEIMERSSLMNLWSLQAVPIQLKMGLQKMSYTPHPTSQSSRLQKGTSNRLPSAELETWEIPRTCFSVVGIGLCDLRPAPIGSINWVPFNFFQCETIICH